jgi:beta-glucanase (GH16 family)
VRGHRPTLAAIAALAVLSIVPQAPAAQHRPAPEADTPAAGAAEAGRTAARRAVRRRQMRRQRLARRCARLDARRRAARRIRRRALARRCARLRPGAHIDARRTPTGPTYDARGVAHTDFTLTVSGSEARTSFKIHVQQRTYFQNVQLAVRNSAGRNYDFAFRSGLTVYPGAPVTVTGSRTLPSGTYKGWIAYRKGGGSWVDMTPTKTFSVAEATSSPAPSPTPVPTPSPIPPPAGALTFAEECDGTAVDPSKWVSEWGVYFGTDADFMKSMSQISMGGGNCTITAERKPTPSGRPWASGLMSTHNRFSQAYGRFEIRAKLPKGQGLWPAFWLLPQATFHGPPEIDVMEAWTNPLGTTPIDASSTSAAVHYGTSYNPDPMHSVWYKGPDFTLDYHTYAVDWRPGSITMIIDGVERGRITSNVPSVPMYLIVNLAVGSIWGGRPDATTPSPSHMLIDYMRVYS